MECPHLANFDKLTTSPNLKTILAASQNGTKCQPQTTTTSKQLTPQTSRGTRSNNRSNIINNSNNNSSSNNNNSTNSQQTQHQCQVCKSDRSPWMCVLCGQVNCGRYVNSHARKHFLNDNQHFLAICCHSRAAFCYACDDYVVNENQSKCILRVLEQFQNTSSNNQTSPNKPNKRKDSLNEQGLSPSTKDNTKAKRARLAGIRNLGNTCYMNSVLQCLSNIQRFTSSVGEPPGNKVITDSTSNGSGIQKRKLIQLANVTDNSKSEQLFETLRNTIYLLKKSGKSFIIPESLFTMIGKNPRFRGYQQQDAHEFLRYVLDRLDKECLEDSMDKEKQKNNDGRLKKTMTKNHASMIAKIFGGVLQNEVNCLECGFKSHKQDPFMDLSLDIPSPSTSTSNLTSSANTITTTTNNNNNFNDVTPSSNNSDNSNLSSCNSTTETNNTTTNSDSCHLIDCLSSFIELEELTETELYYCSNCQQKQRSTKRFWIRRLPDVLCLHLKRFRYNNFLRTKIDDFIQFPTQGLDMKRFVMANKHETRGSSCGPTTYDLVAFIEHHGTGLGSGHYTAYCRHEDYWFHLDDSTVTPCDESTVRKSKAYILFYNRRTS